ncbi:MAG: enoyl-CoA hydratase-related protein [Elusimicrobiota bacterium]|nr:enoyl-CoA hydratase-related protein [Elusimicrobiota bacterium]
MDYEILKTAEADGILTVTLSRPKALNALNSLFFREMDNLIASVARRPELKALVITGEGKAFVAGADIAEMVGMSPTEAEAFSRAGQATFNSFENLELPVIAAVNGFALGGGCELAMACDIRIASSAAKFGQPEVNLGLVPGYAATQRLPRQAGLGNALYMLLTGDLISAEEALRMGLVQKVVEPDQLMPEVLKLAQKIASKGPKAVRKVKKLARAGLLAGFEKGCGMEAAEFGTLFGNEGTEGMKAFLEKRKPNWIPTEKAI